LAFVRTETAWVGLSLGSSVRIGFAAAEFRNLVSLSPLGSGVQIPRAVLTSLLLSKCSIFIVSSC
jgi:hypothetical protein